MDNLQPAEIVVAATNGIEPILTLGKSDLSDVKRVSRARELGFDTMSHYETSTTMAGVSQSEIKGKDVLANGLISSGFSAQRVQQVTANLQQFEINARQNGVDQTQIQETYLQLNRILGSSKASVSPELRAQFVEQWSAKLADPLSAKQGWHDTCGIAEYETGKLKHDPEKLTRVIADALIDSKTKVPDDSRSLLGQLAFSRPSAPKTTRDVTFDAASFKPDLEAQGKSSHGDARDYADQVAQVTLNTLKWNLKETSPTNWPTTQGSMQFKQCDQVHRPSDTSPPNSTANSSCESVEFTNPFTRAKKVYDDDGHGFGGQTSIEDLLRLDQVLNPKHHEFSLIAGTNHIESEEELRATLAASESNFPLSVFVHPSQPGFREDYLKRHPEKSAVSPNAMWHIIGVAGLNSDGSVQIYNPWGIVKNMSVHDLYQAMQAPLQ
jgi:hypothetical protein